MSDKDKPDILVNKNVENPHTMNQASEGIGRSGLRYSSFFLSYSLTLSFHALKSVDAGRIIDGEDSEEDSEDDFHPFLFSNFVNIQGEGSGQTETNADVVEQAEKVEGDLEFDRLIFDNEAVAEESSSVPKISVSETSTGMSKRVELADVNQRRDSGHRRSKVKTDVQDARSAWICEQRRLKNIDMRVKYCEVIEKNVSDVTKKMLETAHIGAILADRLSVFSESMRTANEKLRMINDSVDSSLRSASGLVAQPQKHS